MIKKRPNEVVVKLLKISYRKLEYSAEMETGYVYSGCVLWIE